MSLSYLEKPLQPPHLEDTIPGENQDLEDAPPLDTRVGALGRVPVGALANNNVALLVLDLRNEFCHLADCDPSACACLPASVGQLTLLLQGVLRRLRLGYVDDAVNVERNLLGVCAPVLVVEAVDVFAVLGRMERVVAGGNAALMDLEAAGGSLDLHAHG